MKWYDIYEEGFIVMDGHVRVHYLGGAYGNTFIEACKFLIEKTGQGEIRLDENGNKYACDWGCRWFPTFEEAQKATMVKYCEV